MTPTILRFGLLFGMALAIGFFASYLLVGTAPENYGKSEIVGYSVMIISSIAVFFAVKEFRDQRNGGQLTFLQGIGIGTSVSAIAGLCFALYNWVYITWLQPGFLKEYQAYSEQQIRQSGQSAEVIEQQLAELAQFSALMDTGIGYLAVMFATVFFIGLLFTLVTAATLKSTHTNED